MHLLAYFLAQATFVKEPPSPAPMPEVSSFTSEVGGILSLALALAVGLFIWAFFIRKSHHPDPHARALQEGTSFTASPSHQHSHHHHGRRRRRRHRKGESAAPRNPTLQETGGLPPVRSENEFPRI